MKTMKNLSKGIAAKEYMSYLNKLPEFMELKANITSSADFRSLDKVEEALAARAVSIVADVMGRFAADPASNEEKMTTIYATEIIDMTKAHLQYLSYKMFKDGIEKEGFKCHETKNQIRALCKVYGLNYLRQNSE